MGIFVYRIVRTPFGRLNPPPLFDRRFPTFGRMYSSYIMVISLWSSKQMFFYLRLFYYLCIMRKLIKKFKRWCRQFFCSHHFVEIRDPKNNEIARKVIDNSFFRQFYVFEYQCVKCGKVEVI